MIRSLSLRTRCATASTRGSAPSLEARLAPVRAREAFEARARELAALRDRVLALERLAAPEAGVLRLAAPEAGVLRLAEAEPDALRLAEAEPDALRLAEPERELARPEELLREPEALLLRCGMFPPMLDVAPAAPRGRAHITDRPNANRVLHGIEREVTAWA